MTNPQRWSPTLGAIVDERGTRFRVWAPAAEHVEVAWTAPAGATGNTPLLRDAAGHHEGLVEDIGAGTRYCFVLDGGEPLPDPASRSQPEGVHGPSEVIDPAFAWHDSAWRALDPDNLVIYELHIGTFTDEGTFEAAARRLPEIAALGVSAVQVMPVAAFAGARNWGYDGVSLFAPAAAYGRPDDFRAFVDRAHAEGIGVILDVVYNHFGPSGAYHARYSAEYFNPTEHTLWGAAINLDQPGSEDVRSFFVESALQWLHEYHVDGLRLDAVHALIDARPTHFLAEFRDEVDARRRPGQPPPVLIAEEHRNLPTVVRPREDGGYGFDASYADDFHHEMHRLLTHESEGFLVDYEGSARSLATILDRGWLYAGQESRYAGAPKGEPLDDVPVPRLLYCLDNHDQVGNRAFGERLHQLVSPEAYRAAVTLLLCGAATPLLFMGDEWGASSPFLYFTDHDEELGRLVTEGRRREFGEWSARHDESSLARIPDPQSPRTFEDSRLPWHERHLPDHASMLRLHETLLALRANEPSLRWTDGSTQTASGLDDDTVALRRDRPGAEPILVIARLRADGTSSSGDPLLHAPPGTRWERLVSTEEPRFTAQPQPIGVDFEGEHARLRFQRPGAVVLRATAGAG